MEGGKTSHYSLTFSLILPLALSDNCSVSSGGLCVERAFSAATCILCIYIYMCICVSVYIYIYQCPYSYTTFKNHNRKSPAKKSSQTTAKEGGGDGKEGQLRGGAP